MYVGADYYPEHWPRERWATDAKLMREAGFNIVRLAEFDWVAMEPEEGRYAFATLDTVLPLLGRHGVSAILCTPTAVMPAWVARKYPEALRTNADGRREPWGVRRHNCFTSGAFRRLSEGITRAMAERFAGTPNVIGWQTDNELGSNAGGCFCESCVAAWQDWLRRRYGTLDELNRAWGTHFWGHRVQTWGEVHAPRNMGTHNPSACLDWKRFNSDQEIEFQHEQVRILRALCPRHFVTHNAMGLMHEIDYGKFAEDLDFVSWDNYPVGAKPGVRYESSMAADIMRGLKRKNFWIMEQSAGPAGWGTFGRNVRPGELRNIAYQQLAHGADAQIWFRWRTCTAGREQYWHGLLGHDGRPLRRYREAAQTAGEYHRLAKELEGTTVVAQVAMIHDYDSIWAAEIQPGYRDNHVQWDLLRYYRALMRAGVNVDLVPKTADLSAYRLVLAPDLYVMPDAVAQSLCRFVRQGGVLLADPRTGVKDESGLCYDRTLPGLLSPALGIEIEEYESLSDGADYAIRGTAELPGDFTATHVADWVTPRGARALAGYADWHMASYAAVTRHRYGKGWGWYVGCVAKEDAFYDAVVARLLADAKVEPLLQVPEGVELSVRESTGKGVGKRLVFLVNHLEEPMTVAVPAGKKDLLTGRKTGKSLELDRFGVAVLRW